MQLQVIETPFDGILFRSRLKARWAVFFKTLGIPYEYEPEKFKTAAGLFCPDFWLPREGRYVHISREESDYVNKLCQHLALGSGYSVLYVVGSPWPDEYRIIEYIASRGEEEGLEPGEPSCTLGMFGEDRKADECLWLLDDNGYACSLTPSDHPKHGDGYPMTDTEWLNRAYSAARGKRF